MSEDFFYTDFAKLSKFKWDFFLNLKDIDKWNVLATNFKTYYKELHNEILLKKNIPRKIHQIWIGPKKIPKKYLNWGKSWIKKNPQWDYKLWTNKEINQLSMINRSLYDSTKNIGFKSDIARYEILYKYGGIYIDTDFECIKEIPNNLRYFDFVSCLGFDYSPTILNGFLMASSKSYIIKKMISELNLPKNNRDPMSIINSSGPAKLTNIYFKYHDNKSLILPSNYCYPYPSFLINSGISKKSEVSSVSFALHHWEMSWMKGSLIKRLFLKFKNLYNKFIKSNLLKS
jgi:mannosyltransferase OCH1-like enzyme